MESYEQNNRRLRRRFRVQNYTLTELIKPNILQQIQDAFSEYSGMASITTDAEGVPVTAGSNFTHFCTDLIRITEAGCKNCFNCDKMGAAQAMETGLPSVYTCLSGLVDFSAPIMLNGKMIGCFVGGQVLTDEPDADFCRRKALEYGIDPDAYIESLSAIKRMPRSNVERSAKLLFDISKALSSMALHNCSEIENSKSMELAARSQSDYIMSLTSDMTSITLDYMDTAKEALDSGDPDEMKRALEMITSRGAGASEMIRDSIAYLQMIGRRFRMSEEEYAPRKVFSAITDSLNQKADSASISLEIEQKIPEILLGDAGGICQLIDKFAALFTENGGKSLQLGISSYKRGYAEMLKIQLCSESAELSDEQIDKIRNIITSDEEYYAETMSELALSIVRTQIRAMSGTFDIFRSGGSVTIEFTIPQLKIEGGAS